MAFSRLQNWVNYYLICILPIFYIFRKNGTLNVTFEAPHSITEWRFSAGFWTPGRSKVCRATPSRSITTTKHVFMDVDVPAHVYVNETIIVRVSVSADNLEKLQNVIN